MKVIKELTKKEFKNFEKETTEAICIVGETVLKKYDKDKHKKYDFVILTDDKDQKEYLVKQDYKGFKSKYLQIADDKFVLVRTRIPFIILMILLLLLIYPLSGLLVREESPVRDIPIVGDIIEEYVTPTAQNESTTIAGLRSSYTLTESNKEIYLVNPDGNTVHFKYVLYVNGEQIYETDYIQPNRMIKANIYDLLDAGTYTLDLVLTTIDVDTHEDCTPVNLQTEVVIVK